MAIQVKPWESTDKCEYCNERFIYNKIDTKVDSIGYCHIVCPYCNKLTTVRPYKE